MLAALRAWGDVTVVGLEARVDRVGLDLADLPFAPLPGSRPRAAHDAVTAWEVAACWLVEPRYARHRLRMLGSLQE